MKVQVVFVIQIIIPAQDSLPQISLRSKRILKDAGAKVVLGMNNILTESVDGSGSNKNYGILGSNKAAEDRKIGRAHV